MAELFGIVTAAIGTVDIIANRFEQLATRYEHFTTNPQRFQKVRRAYGHVHDVLANVKSLLDETGNLLPERMLHNFWTTISSIDARMNESSRILLSLEQYLPALPAASSCWSVTRAKASRLKNARKVAKCLDDLESNVALVGNPLTDLTGFLGLSHRITSIASTAAESQDVFKARFEVPTLPPYIILDYMTSDSSGHPFTMEGKLKHALLSTIASTSRRVAVAVGSIVPGAAGMGGVGKTNALIGLGCEQDLRTQFSGGIYFIVIGQDARPVDVIREIARIVDASGGTNVARSILKLESLKEAISKAAHWFEGRPALFLFDDLWETETSTVGYLDSLRQLLSTCRESRMVISTRSREIALDGGICVEFGPRDPNGQVSRDILLAYANISVSMVASSPSECQAALEKILRECGGIPLTLGVAGRAIRTLSADCRGNWQLAVVRYAKDLEENYAALTDGAVGAYPNFSATMRSSLQILDRWSKSREARQRVGRQVSLPDLLLRMGILRKQVRVPLSMLKRLWRLSDEWQASVVVQKLADLNLVLRELGETGHIEVGLHDLVLEFCRSETRNQLSEYHSVLLKEYLTPNKKDAMENSSTSVAVNGYHVHASKDGNLAARPWWSGDVPNDGYIHANLSRHLVESGATKELLLVLTDMRWTVRRVAIGGLSAWDNDFDELLMALEGEGLTDETGSMTTKIVDGLLLVRDAVREAWAFLVQNPGELPFQVHARLMDIENPLWPVQLYLRSAMLWAPKPWLRPFTRCWQVPGGRLQMEIPLDSSVSDLVLTQPFRYAVAAVRNALAVVNLETGTVTKTLEGHEGRVSCVAISMDGQRIVSGSDDETVRIWDMVSGNELAEPLCGHSNWISCVAISEDGLRVVSGAGDKTLRIWDMNSFQSVGEPLVGHTKSVTCVAISTDGQRIVSGGGDHMLRVWDMASGKEVGNPLCGHTDWVRCVTLSRDGQRIVSGGADETVRIWDVANSKEVCAPLIGHTDWVRSVAISANGRNIVSGASDRTLRVWDMKGGKPVGEPLRGHTDWVRSVAISEDGSRIVSGSRDKTLRVWDMASCKAVDEISHGHTDSVTCVSVSPDGRLITSGSWDDTLRVWELAGGRAVGEPLRGHTDSVTSVATSADGRYVVSGSWDETLRVWDMASGKAVGEPLRAHSDGVFRVEMSAGNVFTSHSGAEVLRWKLDRRHGLVRLEDAAVLKSNSIGNSYDENGERSGNGGFGLQDVSIVCSGRLVKMVSPVEQTLATLPAQVEKDAWYFDQRRRILVTGLRNGAMLWHEVMM